MPVVRSVPRGLHRLLAGLVSIVVLVLAIDHVVAVPLADEVGATTAPPVEAVPHLVVSEVMTGGASASDEFIELYNPSSTTLPLEGLEVVYVTASGATVSRKAAWTTGAPDVQAGAHLLVANAGGIFAGLADVAYTNGLAATGGSVVLRVIGAATAVDAVGWGNATSSWLETRPAPAPAAGSSLERLPGGSVGSSQDTDDNLIDFVVQPIPDPQNSGSPPIASGSPSASPTGSEQPTASPTAEPTADPTSPAGTDSPLPTPSATATATPTPVPTPVDTATPVPTPTVLSIAEARSQPDGATVTVEGVTLTASAFVDGGGYLVDATAGIAILLSDGAFGRGERLRVTGTVDDRYAQRTIRASAATITSLGSATEPLAMDALTGSIAEALEGQLVEITGVISSSVTTLTSGMAWDLDDGSGPVRVLVGTATGIDTASWARGIGLTLIGIVGQRDSSGTGTSGFRIQPRDPADLLTVVPIATATPTPSPEPQATPAPSATVVASASPSASPASPLLSIGEARGAATGTHLRIRGVVTAPSSLIEVGSAVVQDATGAILVRIGTDVGSLALGQLVELDGTRATKAGMLSLRVSVQPLYLGTQADPEPIRRATGRLGEGEEARLVIVRGAISSALSKPRGGNVSFAVDDGSGPIRVTLASRARIPSTSLTRGAWLELRAVLAQETTGSAPSSGYRLWPRIAADLRVLASPTSSASRSTGCCLGGQVTERSPSTGNLPDAVQGQAGASSGQDTIPILARPLPTTSPRQLGSVGEAPDPDAERRSPAGGLVVSGMGLVALAGLAAWFGHRRGPDDDAPAVPRLSVLPSEATDARKERRILPPT
ncbi:MAG: lamin tail domain-containing protein [Chloroflexota bacterium]